MPKPDEPAIFGAGDLAWVNFEPVLGREQSGRRPAVILTSREYHQRSPMAMVCPITSNLGPWPFKVPLPQGLPIAGTVLVDQLRSIDRASRIKSRIGVVPIEVLNEIMEKLVALLTFD